jgi:hypothetical protein
LRVPKVRLRHSGVRGQGGTRACCQRGWTRRGFRRWFSKPLGAERQPAARRKKNGANGANRACAGVAASVPCRGAKRECVNA